MEVLAGTAPEVMVLTTPQPASGSRIASVMAGIGRVIWRLLGTWKKTRFRGKAAVLVFMAAIMGGLMGVGNWE